MFSLKLNDLIAFKLNQTRVRKVFRIQWSTQRARSNQIIQLKRASDANSCRKGEAEMEVEGN